MQTNHPRPLASSATPLCSILETLGRLSIMKDPPLRKRERETEALPDYNDVQLPKRFHGEEKDRFLHLLQFYEALDDDKEEDFAPSEGLVNEFIRSLEKEIAPKSSSSYSESISGDISVPFNISRGHEGETLASDSGFDLCYLLEASDEELGIPPIPVVDLKNEVCLSTREIYQQFATHEDLWNVNQLQDYMTKDLLSQSMLIDGGFSAASRLEPVSGM